MELPQNNATSVSPSCRIWLEVDTQKITHNYQAIVEKVSPLQVMPILKANAYGLGAPTIAQTLVKSGAKRIGVADLNEAMVLSKALGLDDRENMGCDIQLLGGLIPEEISPLVEHGFIAPVTDYETALYLSKAAQALNRTCRVHCLVDTGMGRLGIPIETAQREIEKIAQLPNLELLGLYSHFPDAYSDMTMSNKQINELVELKKSLEEKNIQFDECHIANSDGINNIDLSQQRPFTHVRSGINLYGVYDMAGQSKVNIKPVLSLKSRLVAIRNLKKGSSIGYGKSLILEKDTLVGTISAGYADGLPLALSGQGHVNIGNDRCSILGRLSMDYTTIDLTNAKNPSIGDEVICLGNDVLVSDWARLKATHEYDIICGIGNRVQRVYI